MSLVLFARYTPPGWDDPIPECANGHNWGYWRPHPNGYNDVRACRRPSCTFSDWRLTIITANRWPDGGSTMFRGAA